MKKSKAYPIVLTGLFIAIIVICAWISIPMIPISITLQTLGVFLAAAILGRKKGTIAVIIYILLGAIGLPVFSNFSGGFGVILSPIGGYLIGFVPTAHVTGFITERVKCNMITYMIAMTAGLIVCYIIGTAWYCFYMNVNVPTALLVCVVPFLIGDAVKIFVASLLATKLKKHII